MAFGNRLINTGGAFAPEYAASTLNSFGISDDNNFATKTVTLTLDYLDPATSTYINYYTEQWIQGGRNNTFTPASGAALFATNTKTRRTIRVTGSMSSVTYLTPNTITRAGSYVFSNVAISKVDSGDSLYTSISSTSVSGTGINYSDTGNYNLLGVEMIFNYTL